MASEAADWWHTHITEEPIVRRLICWIAADVFNKKYKQVEARRVGSLNRHQANSVINHLHTCGRAAAKSRKMTPLTTNVNAWKPMVSLKKGRTKDAQRGEREISRHQRGQKVLKLAPVPHTRRTGEVPRRATLRLLVAVNSNTRWPWPTTVTTSHKRGTHHQRAAHFHRFALWRINRRNQLQAVPQWIFVPRNLSPPIYRSLESMQKVHDAFEQFQSSRLRSSDARWIHHKNRSGRINDVSETVRVDQSVSGSFRVFYFGAELSTQTREMGRQIKLLETAVQLTACSSWLRTKSADVSPAV